MTRLLRLLSLAALLMFGASAAHAQLTFSLRSGNDLTKTQKMVFDSNKCSAATPEGPRAMYLGGRVINNGLTTALNVKAKLTGLGTIFNLAGQQPEELNLGSIEPGQSAGAYWYVGDTCTEGTVSPLVTVTATNMAQSLTSLTLTGTKTLSANATGFLESATVGPGAVVGQTIYVDVAYSFGGTGVGDEFFLQPSGLRTFNAACFRLVGSKIKSSTVTGIPAIPATDNTNYFQQTAKQTQKADVTVTWAFEYQCQGASTTIRPYAMGTSGTQIKYTGNYESAAGTFTLDFPGATNPFAITKTQTLTQAYINARPVNKYTVTVTNPSVHASRISSFVDILPAGAEFVSLDGASNVTAALSASMPVAGATGTLTFTGKPDISYLIPAGGTAKLIYYAKMPSPAGTYVNSVSAKFSQATTPSATATFNVIPPPPLTIVKSSQVAADPYNGTTNPKAVPGARMLYTIGVTNPNPYSVTADSIVIIDARPAKMKFYAMDLVAGQGPVRFLNGAVPSGLTYTFTSLASTTDDVDFTKNGGADNYQYVPVPDASGVDPLVTHIRIRPKGAMNPASSFNVLMSFVVD